MTRTATKLQRFWLTEQLCSALTTPPSEKAFQQMTFTALPIQNFLYALSQTTIDPVGTL